MVISQIEPPMELGLAHICLLLESRLAWEVALAMPSEGEEVGPKCCQNLHDNHFHDPKILHNSSWGHQQLNEQEGLVELAGEPSNHFQQLQGQLLFLRSLDVSHLLGDPRAQIYYSLQNCKCHRTKLLPPPLRRIHFSDLFSPFVRVAVLDLQQCDAPCWRNEAWRW